MKTMRMTALAVAAVILAAAAASATLSEPVLVDTTYGGRHWATVFTRAVPLQWDWPADATHAKLDIAGMNSAFTTNFATVTSNCVWHVFETDSPAAEDVYGLTVTFYSGSATLVETLTARLAVVKGAFGEAAVNAVAASTAWSKIRGNAVIPYDASWSPAATNAVTARLEIAKEGGASQTNAFADVAGYFGWRIRNSGWGYGNFNLSLTFPGTDVGWTALLTRPADGMLIRVQ